MRIGAAIDPHVLRDRALRHGYVPEDRVADAGDVVLRGGVVDTFPAVSELPVHIRLDGGKGSEIDRIDPATQLTIGRIEAVTPGVAGEMPPPEDVAEERERGEQPWLPAYRDDPVRLVDHPPGPPVFLSEAARPLDDACVDGLMRACAERSEAEIDAGSARRRHLPE